MNLTKKQIKKYEKTLRSEPNLKNYIDALTATQRRFSNLVLFIIQNPSLTATEVSTILECGEATVYRALIVIKGCYLPFRVSERMKARAIANEYEEADTALGRMNENSISLRASRRKKREKKSFPVVFRGL